MIALVLTILTTTTPCHNPTWQACYTPATKTIELRPGSDQLTLHHEIGHAIDHQTLTPNQRAWYTQQTAANPHVPANERYADLYAACVVNGLEPGVRGTIYVPGYWARYPAAIYRRICRRILAI